MDSEQKPKTRPRPILGAAASHHLWPWMIYLVQQLCCSPHRFPSIRSTERNICFFKTTCIVHNSIMCLEMKWLLHNLDWAFCGKGTLETRTCLNDSWNRHYAMGLLYGVILFFKYYSWKIKLPKGWEWVEKLMWKIFVSS